MGGNGDNIVISDEAYPYHMALLLDRSREGGSMLVIHVSKSPTDKDVDFQEHKQKKDM